jgi:hypothetical protein
MNPRLKKIIFSKLNDDLSKVEIILSENQSIWFIDRANKYWYFELEKSGKLWWRYEFFTNFFPLFCLEIDEFQPLLSEWVEGVLNCGVNTTDSLDSFVYVPVEGILNRGYRKGSRKVDEVLNREINEIDGGEVFDESKVVEYILNHKVVSISHANEQNELIQQILVNELIYEVESADPLDTPASDSVDEVLKNS